MIIIRVKLRIKVKLVFFLITLSEVQVLSPRRSKDSRKKNSLKAPAGLNVCKIHNLSEQILLNAKASQAVRWNISSI